MANKPSKASIKGKLYLEKNPTATMEEVAKHCGLTVSAVQKSSWWKNRAKEQK